MRERGFNSEPEQSFPKTDKWIRPAPRASGLRQNDSVVFLPHMRGVKKKEAAAGMNLKNIHHIHKMNHIIPKVHLGSYP
jgi:phosphoglycerate dehydrogenase-like enzyme